MDKGKRSWLMLGFATVTLGASAALVGMTHPTPAAAPNSEWMLGFSPGELAAKDVLKSELTRRFTDRQNVDFGMSRIIRPGHRIHTGPVMNIYGSPKNANEFKDTYRKKADGKYETFIEGEWHDANQVKPVLSPENENEREAVETLKAAKIDVAIYTVGQFELDNGEAPVPDPNNVNLSQPHYNGFQWGRYDGLRAKGPAYLTQKSGIAPRAHEVVEFGRRAWASKRLDYVQEGKDGWVFFAHRVSAPDMSCAKCHGDRQIARNNERVMMKGAVQKSGDPVGLFVVAMRRK